MAGDFSFDIVSKIDLQEVDNAVNLANKEISTRYDFKGSKSKISFDREGNLSRPALAAGRRQAGIEVLADDEPKLKSVVDILQSKLVKRGISLKALSYGRVEQASGGKARLTIDLVQGIEQEKAKHISKFLRKNNLKLNVQIQGDQVRVSSKSKDSLQTAISLIKGEDFGIPLQFTNFR